MTPPGRLEGIQLSEIIRIAERARQLAADGREIIALATGEPDFPTPAHVIDAATAAMQAGQTRYTPTAGTPALRDAVCAATERDCGYRPERAEVIISCGAKQVLYNIFAAGLEAGDAIIIPSPCWASYLDMARMCGADIIDVPCGEDAGFKLDAPRLDKAITPRTRWLLLNNPTNPSGAVYDAEELQALAEVLRRHAHVGVIADEIYQHISYAPFTSFRSVAPDLADRTVIVNGVSKTWSMTGWRIGWGIGPEGWIRDMTKVQGQVTSGACSISQAAALAAITGPQELRRTRADIFCARRDAAMALLNGIPGLACPRPDGAFYAFASCAGVIDLATPAGQIIADDGDFCAWILEQAGVAVVPGRAFRAPGHFRLSYACDEATLQKAGERMAQACAMLS